MSHRAQTPGPRGYPHHKVGGHPDFSGQEERDGGHDTPSKEGHESRDIGKHHFTEKHNKFNGSGGSRKVIAPHNVKGINR